MAQSSPGVLGNRASPLRVKRGAKGDSLSKGAADGRCWQRPVFARMGHARNRPKRLAEKLLQIREALGLSQTELAERLGNYRAHHHISKYERGKSAPPIEVVLAYSRLANVQIEQIVDDDVDLNL